MAVTAINMTFQEYYNYKHLGTYDGKGKWTYPAKVYEFNHNLIEKYPFLKPKYYQFDDEDVNNPYDYSWTLAEDIPKGWLLAFGEDLFKELKEALGDEIKDYRVLQIKEKFGQLRWYDTGASQAVDDVIDKFTNLSETTCIACGRPAKYISKGWISPFCENCIGEQERNEI